MRRFLRWAALVAGTMMVLYCVAVFLWFAAFMHRYGGIPWSWDFISDNAHLFERWALWLVAAVTLIGLAMRSFRVARRQSRNSN